MRNQIKTSRKAIILGKLAAWLIRLVGCTLRIDFRDAVNLKEMKTPVILCLWHNRVFITPYLWQRQFSERRAVVLTSASRDGATLAAAVGAFGMGAVRGSSSRRGMAALVALKKEAENGADICVTPDGPKGPRYQLKPGLVKLAQMTDLPVVTIRIDCQNAWILNSWDRFRIPKPFSRVEVSLEHRLDIPKNLDEAAFEETRLLIERAMCEGHDDSTNKKHDDGNNH